jgi:Zn-finger nucleic acid-binding protein
MSERQGIEIDYCPQCRGIWLDRGELDKIIERSVSEDTGKGISPPPQNSKGYYDDHKHHDKGYYKGRQKSWLSDLFD